MFNAREVDTASLTDCAASEKPCAPLTWIETRPGLPYFVTEHGAAWTPVGHNDAVTWPELGGLFRRKDVAGVEQHLRWLKAHGVTCLRLMLEYCHGEHRYIEKPVGRFVPNMVKLWDDLFALCEKVGLYILLTPFDTFFTWIRWKHHPYNRRNGGTCSSRRRLLTCMETRRAIKARLAFAAERWSASPALFAWDLWNEMHPAHGQDDPETLVPFVDDLSGFLRETELRLHGRSHLQTVSVFGPELLKTPELADPIFRHPSLDFANVHLYESRTIDDPRDTVAPAIATGRLMRAALLETNDQRPVFDSEHGPIHAFKDRHRILPEAFDDEYFRHIQWAHVASGGAGGGMRWPNRHPHVLTPGMREAQRAMAGILPLIDWTGFRRRNLNDEIRVSDRNVAAFGCGDAEQALLWLLRTDGIRRDGTLDPDAPARPVHVEVPGLRAGSWDVVGYDTRRGRILGHVVTFAPTDGGLLLDVPAFSTDIAVVIRRSA